MIIPLYTYPTDGSWSAVIQAKQSYPTVPIVAIINPDSGPGSSKDPNYATGITNLENAGVVVLGYVATGYGTSSYSSIKNIERQVHDYKSWYPDINGIFFDEMSTSASEQSYYQTLESYTTSLGLQFNVGNPGTTVDTALIGIFNNLVIYENPGLPSVSDIDQYFSAYGSQGFSYIAYGVSSLPSQSTMQSLDTYVGYIYITNLGGSNPYDGLPSYFTNEIAALAATDSTSSASSTTTTITKSSTSSTTTISGTTTSDSSSSSSTTGGRVTIRIKTASLSGATISGLFTTVYSSTGKVLKQGYSTLSFNATEGQTYRILVDNYRNYLFNHWNTGSQSAMITITPTEPATYVAYYTTSGSSLSN
jgi:Spherulation-specific family 4